MSDLIVITYENEQTAFLALNKLIELQKIKVIALEDAAVAVMNPKGKVKVTQTLENQHAGGAATFGFFWGFLIGLIFGGPLFWGLFTALLAGLLGKKTDLGVDNKFIKDVGNSLEPGQAALFMLVISVTPDKVLPEMEKLGGTVFQTSLSQEAEDQLRKALEHEHISAAVSDNLELVDAEAAA